MSPISPPPSPSGGPRLTGRQVLNRVLVFTVVKVGLLVGLYVLCFSPPHRTVVTPGSVEATLFSPSHKDGGAP